MITWS